MTVDDIVNGMGAYLDSGGEANYIAMTEGLGIVGQIASLIIGLLVVVIIVGMPIVIAIEVCYINFPVFQDAYDRIYKRLRGRAESIFGLVIRDARKSVEIANTIENGTSANWVYLRIKIKAVFLSIFIVAMVLGPGGFIIKIAFEFARNIISVFF